MSEHPDWQAVARWYHGFFTGVVMRTVVQRGAKDAAELMFRIFRRQHHAKFLPGLDKLGIAHLPDAVKAAQYHYLSNRIGGVRVEYMYESDRKAWVRFPPPRWVWNGIAICAIPSEVSTAFLRAWQAHNGVSLGNRRLGFVCTGQTVDGDPGLEGYFYEHDHDLAPDQRLRFARHEHAPEFDPAAAPQLNPADWPAERLAKAHRNYSMEYVRSMLPDALHQFGEMDARHLLGGAGRLVGMQIYPEVAGPLGIGGNDTAGFTAFMQRLGTAQGDRVTVNGNEIRQQGWALMRGVPEREPVLFDIWNALLEGALACHNHRLRLVVTSREDFGDDFWGWRIMPR